MVLFFLLDESKPNRVAKFQKTVAKPHKIWYDKKREASENTP